MEGKGGKEGRDCVSWGMRWMILMGVWAWGVAGTCQKLYTVDYASQADVKLFVVDYASQADLCVYRVDYASQATGNEGKWFWVDYASQADKKVFFVDYASQADLKVFFVDYPSQAAWRSQQKRHLFY